MGNAGTSPPNVGKSGGGTAKPTFRKDEYGLAVLVLFCGYVATFIGVVILAPTSEFRLAGMAATTVVYTVVGILVTAIYRPAYIDKFPISINDATRALVMVGSLILTARFIFRQQTIDGAIEAMLLAMIALLILNGGSTLLFSTTSKLPKEWDPSTPAYLVSLVAFVLAMLLVPAIFRNATRTETLLWQINLILLLVFWLQILGVLDVLTRKTTRKEALEEGFAGIVIKDKRIDRVEFGRSVDLARGEKVDPFDLRMQRMTMSQGFESKDHANVRVHASCTWRPIATEADVRRFKTHSDVAGQLKEEFRATIAAEIGMRVSAQLTDRQDFIAQHIRLRMVPMVLAKGVQIETVMIVLRTSYPTLAQGGAPSIEAERLRQIDQATRVVIPQTLQHVQKQSESRPVEKEK
jgi:hypothetical protein